MTRSFVELFDLIALPTVFRSCPLYHLTVLVVHAACDLYTENLSTMLATYTKRINAVLIATEFPFMSILIIGNVTTHL